MFPHFWKILSHYFFKNCLPPFSPAEISIRHMLDLLTSFTSSICLSCFLLNSLTLCATLWIIPNALFSNSAIFSQLHLSNLLFSLHTDSSFQWLYFLFLKLPIIFIICLVIFHNLLVHVCDFFIIYLNVSFGVILESVSNNSNIWSPWGSKSVVCCFCWFSHMFFFLTNSFDNIDFWFLY